MASVVLSPVTHITSVVLLPVTHINGPFMIDVECESSGLEGPMRISLPSDVGAKCL